MQTARKTKLLVVVLALAMVFSTVAFAGSKTYRKTSLSYTMQPDFLNVSAPFSTGYGTDTGFNAGQHGANLDYVASVNFTAFGSGEYAVDGTSLFCGYGTNMPFLIGCSNYNKLSVIRFTAPVTGTYNLEMSLQTWDNAYVYLAIAKINSENTINEEDWHGYGRLNQSSADGTDTTNVNVSNVTLKKGEVISMLFRDADESNISSGVKSVVRLLSLNVTGTSEAYASVSTDFINNSNYAATSSTKFGSIELGYGPLASATGNPFTDGLAGAKAYRAWKSVDTGAENKTCVGQDGDSTNGCFMKPSDFSVYTTNTNTNIIKMTAPADGVYSYNVSAYAWNSDNGAMADIMLYRKNAGSDSYGQVGDRNPMNLKNNAVRTLAAEGVSMKAGDAFYFVFLTWSGCEDGITITKCEFTAAGAALPIASDMLATVSADGGYYTADKEDTTYEAATKGALALTVKFDPAVIGGCADITAMGVYVYESGKGMTDHSVTVTAAELTDNGNEGYYRILITDVTPEQFGKIAVAVPYVVYGTGEGAVTVPGASVSAAVEGYQTNWLGIGTLPA